MTCVVTGATGYIGTVLVMALSESGHNIISLVVKGDDISYIGKYSRIVYGDVRKPETLDQAFENADWVVHLAGVIDIGSSGKTLMREVNVVGTKNVIDACERKRVKRLVYVSSVHAIPEKPDAQTMAEINEFDPGQVRGMYAKTKAEATRLVLEAARDGQIDAIVLQPSGVIGPYERHPSMLGTMIIDYLCGALTAYPGRGQYNFVDVRDVAQGILLALRQGECGECYILSGQVMTVERMIQIVSQTSGQPMLKIRLPHWFLMATSIFAEGYYALRRQKPLFTRYSLQTLISNCNFSNQKARERLGLTFRSAERSVSDMVGWILAHHVKQIGGRFRRCAYRV